MLLLALPARVSAGNFPDRVQEASEGFEKTEKAVLADDVASAKTEEASSDEPDKVEHLDSVIVSASRAGKSTPVTYTMVGKQELRSVNPINSLPMALSLQPSVVTTNEGGTGLGYSKMTIRGSKGTQVNVTLNGITLNDAESQEVFWVNIPALSNILSSVQIQRGLGTSANGPGAFGGSINMSTASVGAGPYGQFTLSAGSFGTLTTSVAAGTGLTDKGFYASAAYSRNVTDGYIRNAKADVQSALAVIGWMRGNNSLKFTYLLGDQHTGITWNGISLADYERDRTYNSAGEYYDSFGNVRYYDNETDNYNQQHFQLNYTHQFENGLCWSTTANATKGYGYYEQYKTSRELADYHLPSPAVIGGVPYEEGDVITQEILDNWYYALNSSLKYVSERLDLTGGIYLSRYDGDHVGDVIWSNLLGDSYDYDGFNAANSWYLNNGLKQEFNAFMRAEYKPAERLTAYADLQYRGISLEMSGTEDDGVSLDYEQSWNFFNPRVGLSYDFSPAHRLYASASLGHREPSRSDLKETILTANSLAQSGHEAEIGLKPEKMLDIEIGYQLSLEKFSASANVYLMEYWDMLLETGKISDSGYTIKENVDRSWRRGVELAAAWQPIAALRLDANATFSVNEIDDYTCYLEDWTTGGTREQKIGRVTMLMSPSFVGMAKLSWQPFKLSGRGSLKTTTLAIDGKYVGEQYWDNTGDDSRKVPAYFVMNASLSHEFNVGSGKLGLRAYVNNLLNNMYYADAWVYRAYQGGTDPYYQEEGVFPQAPINFMFGVTYSF